MNLYVIYVFEFPSLYSLAGRGKIYIQHNMKCKKKKKLSVKHIYLIKLWSIFCAFSLVAFLSFLKVTNNNKIKLKIKSSLYTTYNLLLTEQNFSTIQDINTMLLDPTLRKNKINLSITRNIINKCYFIYYVKVYLF